MIDIDNLKDIDDEDDVLESLDNLFDVLDIDKPSDDQMFEMYGVFLNDIVRNPIIIKGVKLSYNRNRSVHPICRGKMKAFEHLITRESKLKGKRDFDRERANKIHWIKPVIEHFEDSRIKYFEKVNDKGFNQLFYWYQDKNFIVIIREINPDLMLITAFSVDTMENVKYQEMYDEYRKV